MELINSKSWFDLDRSIEFNMETIFYDLVDSNSRYFDLDSTSRFTELIRYRKNFYYTKIILIDSSDWLTILFLMS